MDSWFRIGPQGIQFLRLIRFFHLDLAYLYIWLISELRDAINRRHIETLEKAIALAQSSRYIDNVAQLRQEAETVLGHLRQLDRFAHEVLEMKQPTISEIHSYKKPQPLIFDVMQATFLLLGEKDYHIDVSIKFCFIGRLQTWCLVIFLAFSHQNGRNQPSGSMQWRCLIYLHIK